jgi:putative endonuclease
MTRQFSLSERGLGVNRSLVKTYYVYVLLCADDSFYTGITSALETRVGQHQFGVDRACYTFTRRPVTLVHASDFCNADDAIAWEKHLKRWSRAKKMALIANDWPRVQELAQCLNLTSAKYFGGSSFDSAQDDTVP